MQKLYIKMFFLSFNIGTVFSSDSLDKDSDKKDKLYLAGQQNIATIIASESSKVAPAFISTNRMFLKHNATKRRTDTGKKA